MPKKPNAKAVLAAIRRRAKSPDFQKRMRDLLVELCRIDTTPNGDVSVMRAAEDKTFGILERELGKLSFTGARAERRPINPAIKNHHHYSLLHFTKTKDRPGGLTSEETYAGRHNLLYVIHGSGEGAGRNVAVNAHVDVVAPYFPPRVKGDIVFGRGSCDDKGSVVGIIAALHILSEVMRDAGLRWKRNVVAMLVIEEETGGNGSLSLALDRDLKNLYDSILIGEITSLKLHPANRGAVWYRAELKAPGASLFEMAAFINEELEKEGAAIRAESRHDLFPQRPVQTCHGIIGGYGEHPSRICGEVSFVIRFDPAPDKMGARAEAQLECGSGLSAPTAGTAISEPVGALRPLPHSGRQRATEMLVRDCLEAAVAEYTGLYGDKTNVNDPSTGKPMVTRHYDFRRDGAAFAVTVHGATGHMGSIRERDGAITKMSHIVRSLVRSRAKIESLAGGPVRLELGKAGRGVGNEIADFRKSAIVPSALGVAGEALVLEGGQGFVPTHDIREVTSRLQAAAARGAENYLRLIGRPERGADAVRVTCKKLHNAAFESDPNSPTMRNAIAAAKAVGIWKDEPIRGWTVSCDARLFATEYPGMDVVTFGPGLLAHAHSDVEQISIRELSQAIEFLAVFLLKQTGSMRV